MRAAQQSSCCALSWQALTPWCLGAIYVTSVCGARGRVLHDGVLEAASVPRIVCILVHCVCKRGLADWAFALVLHLAVM